MVGSCLKILIIIIIKKLDNNGEYKYCKVFRGSKEIEKGLWRYILKHQLKITQEEFNEKIK